MVTESEVAEIQRRARTDYLSGAVLESYDLDLNEAIHLLNTALSSESLFLLRYRQHAHMLTGHSIGRLSEHLLRYSDDSLTHVDRISRRIVEMGGLPNLDPAHFDRKWVPFQPVSSVEDVVVENLVSARMLIELYRQLVRFFGNEDPTTRRLFEDLLASKESHASDLSRLLSDFSDVLARMRPAH